MLIAIIAHDGKKAEMVQFLNENADILHKNEIELISTGWKPVIIAFILIPLTIFLYLLLLFVGLLDKHLCCMLER